MGAVAPLYLLAALLVASTWVFARVLQRHPTLRHVVSIEAVDEDATAGSD